MPRLSHSYHTVHPHLLVMSRAKGVVVGWGKMWDGRGTVPSGAPAAAETMEGVTIITFTHMMDHNKCINRDDDTIRMLIYCW